MSASIFGTRALFSNRSPNAWWDAEGAHNFFDSPNASEAISRADMNYPIWIKPAEFKTESGIYLPTGKGLIVRGPVAEDPNERVLGHNVSLTYEVITNASVAKLLDPLCAEWPVETVGALEDGKTSFISLKLPGFNVKGEEVEVYALAYIPQTGVDTWKIVVTSVRVVCRNTLVSGLKSATLTLETDHRPGSNARSADLVKLFGLLRDARIETFNAFELVANVQFDDAQAEEVFLAAYPDVKASKAAALKQSVDAYLDQLSGAFSEDLDKSIKQNEYLQVRQEAFRAGAQECLNRINDEHPAIAGSGYAVYQAVTETENYRTGPGKMATQILLGQRGANMARAFGKVLQIAKGSEAQASNA